MSKNNMLIRWFELVADQPKWDGPSFRDHESGDLDISDSSLNG